MKCDFVCLFIKKGKNKLGLSGEAALSSAVSARCWWWSLETSLLCPLDFVDCGLSNSVTRK